MKRCPQCHRFGIEVNQNGQEQCIWRDCLWLNKDNIDVDKVEHPIEHWLFINAIQRKTNGTDNKR